MLLGDGASDVFIGDGTNNVDIVFEQNGEIRDDASGKNITLGSKTTNIFITGSNTIAMQKDGGNVGIGTTTAGEQLEVTGNISGSSTSTIKVGGNITSLGTINVDEIHSVTQTTNKLILEDDQSVATNMVSLMSVNHINLIADGNNNGTGRVRIMDGNYDVDSATAVADFSPEYIYFQSPITASGNISASGTGIFNKLEVHGADGTLQADYIIHKDDDNTKFGFPANDKFKVRTNNVDKYVISKEPACVGPSAPTKPALSIANLTGKL